MSLQKIISALSTRKALRTGWLLTSVLASIVTYRTISEEKPLYYPIVWGAVSLSAAYTAGTKVYRENP